MSINPKDTIIAFSNIWTTYFIIRYLQVHHIEVRRKYFSTLIGLTIGFGLGIRTIFLATLIPIVILFFLDIFLLKVISKKKILILNFFKDFIKIFIIAYFMMVAFWPEVHSNIFILPFKLIIESFKDISFGTPWVLLAGEFFNTNNTPRAYLLKNLFYKLPEYLMITYFFLFLYFFMIRNSLLNILSFLKKIIISIIYNYFSFIYFICFSYKNT